ncbi:hypothetical protein [Carnobacterium sp. ISL-102]|uniref:hypothetical protein n=1 Tax=Carnobacterium sp. ISL-102 TaxID=2819142 RepID=UPI001BEA296A|nr:hypothetical protein [Carnobacterium sp. ISL-102]MBT2731037.1 hypothetical protein [Carnobacterium sp. ISL-102]
MKSKGIHLLLAMSLILLANFNSQSVLAANDEMDSSVGSESAASDETRELEEDVKPVLTNEITVSDKLMIEPEKAHAGEQIAFKLTLSEDQIFETIMLSYSSSDTEAETTVALTYDSETERYEGRLETNKETGIGTWSLTKAVGVEENNVSSVLETRALITEESVLKKGDFEVIPHPAALFDLSSIKVEPNTVKVGEKPRFSLYSAKDDLLTNVTVAYRLLSLDGETADQQLTLSLTFNEETKAYEGKLPSIANQLVGDWVIEYLSAVGSKGDSFLLYNRFVIELDQAKMHEQLAELNNQLLEEQMIEELEETDDQSKIDLLKAEIKQLETRIKAKEKMLQTDLSIGNFTVQEDIAEEDAETIDEEIDKEMPIKNEAESGTSEEEPLSLLTESDAVESKENVSAAVGVENSSLIDEQKAEDVDSMTSEKTSAIEEVAQTVERSSVNEEIEADKKSEATGFMKGSLFIVLAAFVIINGFIFKF